MMERKSQVNALFIGTFSILLGVMVFSPHLAFAQEDFRSPTILPDSPFYGLKLAWENIRETFTFQEEKRAELILKHSEERDIEAIALEKQGKIIPIEKLKAIQSEKIMNAEKIILKLERAQNIIDQKQEMADDRKELAQATNEQERIVIQMQQKARERAESANLIEPNIGGSNIIEPLTKRVADKPITILPVKEIEKTDDTKTVLIKLRDRLENSFSTSEITEIRAKFAEVRLEPDPVRKERLAEQLDEKVNNPMVSITCLGRVNTLSLSLATDPVRNLQEQCPILRPFPTDMVRDVLNGGT